jgi:hypothetical protein
LNGIVFKQAANEAAEFRRETAAPPTALNFGFDTLAA